LATAAPPATASEPPGQKSFCTSTITSARMTPRYPALPGAGPCGARCRATVPGHGAGVRCRGAVPGAVPHPPASVPVGDEAGRDRRVAAGELERGRRQLRDRVAVPLPGRAGRLAAGDLAAPDELAQQRPAAALARRGVGDPLGHRAPVRAEFPCG